MIVTLVFKKNANFFAKNGKKPAENRALIDNVFIKKLSSARLKTRQNVNKNDLKAGIVFTAFSLRFHCVFPAFSLRFHCVFLPVE
jgi:hypothetical protein